MVASLFTSNSDSMTPNKNKLGGGIFVNTGRLSIAGDDGLVYWWSKFMALSSL